MNRPISVRGVHGHVVPHRIAVFHPSLLLSMYACMYVCMHACIYIYIYIYIERERDIERERCMHLCMYVYIYIYIFGPAGQEGGGHAMAVRLELRQRCMQRGPH